MPRKRVVLSAQYSPDGPHLQAILDLLTDMFDMLDDRLPKASASGEPVQVEEPAVPAPPAEVVPIQEPAPVEPPVVDEGDGEDEESGPVEVTEPASTPERPNLVPPPRGGPGSGLPAWQQFADGTKVQYSPDANRDDIIAACERAGVIETR